MSQNTETQSLPLAAQAYRVPDVLKILGGINRATLWKLEQRGLIKSVPGFRRNKLYSAKEIERFLAGGRANGNS